MSHVYFLLCVCDSSFSEEQSHWAFIKVTVNGFQKKKTIKSIIACFTRVEPVSIFLWSAEVSSARGGAGTKLMTHYWAIQSDFQECVILVTILGWGFWPRRSRSRLCDPLFSAVARDTISAWHMRLTSNGGLIFPDNLPRDLRGACRDRLSSAASSLHSHRVTCLLALSREWFLLFACVLKGGS